MLLGVVIVHWIFYGPQASTAMLLQAALLAPQAAVPEAAQDAEMEEEAVDFEADDMEEDTTAAAKQSSKAEEHVGLTDARLQDKITELCLVVWINSGGKL